MADEEQNRPDDTPEAGAPADEGTPAEDTPTEDAQEASPPPGEPEAAAEEAGAEEPAQETPVEDAPPAAEEDAAEEPASPADEPAPPAEEPAAEAQEPAAEEKPRRTGKDRKEPKEEVIPGAHLEPDLVLEEERQAQQREYGEYGAPEGEETPAEEGAEATAEPEPVERKALDLAADARYIATGKRKSAVARVILKPGDGTYTVNGKELNVFFPRPRLQVMAKQPLTTAGYETRMDVVAKIHGGGVSSQASALRHGIARALVEADPALRIELKRRGYLTRDPRVKERKKAGLKKARKRPQFSKR